MCDKDLKRLWLRRQIKAIHRYDQCKAIGDDMATSGDPRLKNARNLQRLYELLGKLAEEQVTNYRESEKKNEKEPPKN